MKYTYEDIDALVQPLMEMMRHEHPNNCKLIITGDSAEIVYEHIDMVFCTGEE